MVRLKSDTTGTFIAGLVVGAVAGTVAVLLFTPQSGAATRDDVKQTGIVIRDRAEDVQEGIKDKGQDFIQSQKSRWELAKEAAEEAAAEKRAELLAKFEAARREGEI